MGLQPFEDPPAPTAAQSSEPVPVWFGDEGRSLFGWFHPARAGATAAHDCVAVLCNPFAYDAMIAHYSYKHLARALAERGIATLRFDYYGTGDSAGDDAGPDRVDEWIASIEAARRHAMLCSGASHVAYFGLRMGGLLALAAAERHPVDALVLLGPPSSGRAAVRELRALRMLQPPIASLTNPEGTVPEDENFGFLMTEPMRAAVSRIDPSTMAAAPARRALVVSRDDVSGGERALANRLGSLGVDARLSSTPGYSLALRGDPYTCDLPDRLWSEIAGWLVDTSSKRAAPASRTLPRRPPSIAIEAVREEALTHKGLFGILTEPTQPSPRSTTGVVLLSIGANHHIGSDRMYVRWAREWAALGFRVLRFDLSGVGDSPARPGRGEKEVYSPHSMGEASEAIDLLASRGCDRVVLAGICSGGFVAFYTALADRRVAGVVQINQPTFHWKPGDSLELVARAEFKATKHYKARAFQLETYARVLRGEVHVRAVTSELAKRLATRLKNRGVMLAVRHGLMEEPDDVARGYQTLSARGCEAFVVIGSNDGALDVLNRHLGAGAAKMTGRPGFRLHVFDGTDHIFTPREAQDGLTAMLTEHLVSKFG